MRCENCEDTLCSFRLTAGECRVNVDKYMDEIRGGQNEAGKTINAIVYLIIRGWTCVAPGGINIKELQEAAKSLVETVEGYVCPKKGDKYVFRGEVLRKCNELNRLINGKD